MNPEEPTGAEQWFELGLNRLDQGLPDDAASCFREVLALDPRHARASVNLGMILQRTGRDGEAEQCYRAALQANAGLAHAWFNLGTIYLDRGQTAGALECIRKALQLDSGYAAWHSALGGTLRQAGDAESALAAFRNALELAPEVQEYASDVLHALNCASGESAESIFQAHVSWGNGRSAAQPDRMHEGGLEPGRRLRIGYVAPDFNDAELGCLIEPVLEHREREGFEVLCYSDALAESDDAWRMREFVDTWHATAHMSTIQLADRIREDRVDILVDLAGHGAAGKRVPLFEREPAPVQVSWLGYPSTTGLRAMDCRITDPLLCPPGEERLSTERVLRMPESRCCFKPPPGARYPATAPAARNGRITFGSCRTLEVLSNRSFALWARALRSCPDSRFLLVARGARAAADLLRERFRAQGVEAARVEISEPDRTAGTLAPYSGIDISLDSFPASGTATTLESLWMGVPVVTLAGGTEASRSAAGILTALDLRELVAGSEDEYEEIAAALAADPQRLAQLRRELRPRLERSSLMDARQFTAHLETLFRKIWRDHCALRADPPAAAPPPAAIKRVGPAPRVIVDGVFFQNYATGIARVWRMLFAEWSKSGFAENVLLLDRERTAPDMPGVRVRTVPRHSYDHLSEDRAMLQAVCDEEHATVFASTYFSAPTTTPVVMLVHDMIPEVLGVDPAEPDWREKAHCIGRASRFVAVSRSTARDLRRIHPELPPGSITVAHNGVDALFRPADTREIEDFKRRHRITRPYYLYVGNRALYKNAGAFFRAFGRLPDRLHYGVLCVGRTAGLEPLLGTACDGTEANMLTLSDPDLRLAYGGAVALVYPSMYEGFGMPVAEAMASACPVITTSHASLPEVAGDAAIYVNPFDDGSLAAAMVRVRDPQLRAKLVVRGLQRAGQFSWSDMARSMAAVLSGVS